VVAPREQDSWKRAVGPTPPVRVPAAGRRAAIGSVRERGVLTGGWLRGREKGRLSVVTEEKAGKERLGAERCCWARWECRHPSAAWGRGGSWARCLPARTGSAGRLRRVLLWEEAIWLGNSLLPRPLLCVFEVTSTDRNQRKPTEATGSACRVRVQELASQALEGQDLLCRRRQHLQSVPVRRWFPRAVLGWCLFKGRSQSVQLRDSSNPFAAAGPVLHAAGNVGQAGF